MSSLPPETAARLAHQLRRVDPRSLATGLAALQLLPENADYLGQLEAAAAFVATLNPQLAQRAAMRSEWKPLLKAFDFGSESCEGLFTSSLVSPYAGNCVVLSGRRPGSPFVQSALTAAFMGPAPFPDENTRKLGLAVINAVLRLSDAMAGRAGLGRGMAAVHRPDRGIYLPPDADFARLRAAVTFSADETRAMLGPQGRELLALSITEAFGLELATDDLLTGPLHRRPLLIHGNQLIVALPAMLVTALTAALLRITKKHRPAIVQRFRAAVRERVLESLRTTGLPDPLQQDAWRSPNPVLSSTLRADTDCYFVAHVAVDALEDFDEEELDGRWGQAQELIEAMEQRALELEAAYCALPAGQAPNAFFHLFVLQGFGRWFTTGLGEAPAPLRSPRTSLGADDLEVIAPLEDQDPLALLKYDHAQERLRDRTRVIGFSPLAEYGLYRRYEHSFYISDDAATVLMVDDSLAEEVRLRAHSERDVHAVLLPGGAGFVMVRLVEEDVRIPLYAPMSRFDDVVRMVAELEVDCWATAALPTHLAHPALALSLVQAVVYWLWQLAPSAGALYAAASREDQVVIRIELVPGPEHEAPTENSAEAPTVHAVANEVNLRVPSSFLNSLSGPDNAGERQLMRVVLSGIRDAAAAQGATPPDDAELDRWIELHAPLGRKKKALSVDAQLNWSLSDVDLPPLRRLQDPDFAEVLDELGEALRAHGLVTGPIPSDQRLPVLREAVAWCFAELERLIASLDPNGLLEWLIGRHERLLQRQGMERMTTPTRLACYPNLPELPARLAEDRRRLLSTAIGLRIVIEAVAARSPSGLRPMSLRVHDRLIALAFEGFNRAFDSDALHFGLHDDAMSMLPSGRLGVRREGRWHSGREAYVTVQAEVEVELAARYFARHWQSSGGPIDWVDGPLDRAAVAEFGFSLLDLTKLLAETAYLGLNELEGAAKQMLRSELESRLVAALGWEPGQVAKALELFILRERGGLSGVPSGFERLDTYPWRFNRALSYIRRPLIERSTPQGPQILWGPRHVQDANENLIALATEGRLRAKTPVMQQAITAVRHAETAAFNEAVAARYRSRCGQSVKTNVTRINGLPIERTRGQVVGDIDVLAAERASQTIWSVETKDLGLARTPNEMGHQLEKIFIGKPGHACDVDRHVERTAWLAAHKREVLDVLGLSEEDPDQWSVEALLVTDEALMSPYISEPKVRVIAFRDL